VDPVYLVKSIKVVATAVCKCGMDICKLVIHSSPNLWDEIFGNVDVLYNAEYPSFSEWIHSCVGSRFKM
jgi:hypothetical protein